MKWLMLLCLLLAGCAPLALADNGPRPTLLPYTTMTPAPYLAPLAEAPTSTPVSVSYPAPLQATPNMTAVWQRDTMRITWQAPGYHCVWIDQYPLTCGVNSGSVDLPARGIDTAYQPRSGRVLRLVDYEANVTARTVVPLRVFVVRAPWVRG